MKITDLSNIDQKTLDLRGASGGFKPERINEIALCRKPCPMAPPNSWPGGILKITRARHITGRKPPCMRRRVSMKKPQTHRGKFWLPKQDSNLHSLFRHTTH